MGTIIRLDQRFVVIEERLRMDISEHVRDVRELSTAQLEGLLARDLGVSVETVRGFTDEELREEAHSKG